MRTKLIKANDVAKILDVSTQRVWELTRENRIPFIRLGERQFRYCETALVRWIENGGNTETQEVNNDRR